MRRSQAERGSVFYELRRIESYQCIEGDGRKRCRAGNRQYFLSDGA